MAEPAFELQQAYDRDDLATVVGEVAAALEGDHTLQLHTAEEQLAVEFPSRFVADLRANRDADVEPPVARLELEIEWDDPDGSSVRVETVEDEPAVRQAGSTAIGEGPTEDPATAAMPPEAMTDAGRSSDRTIGADAPDGERTSRFEVYQDRADEWRWRLVHWNGNVIADSGEGYSTRSNARRAARGVMRAAPTATIENTES